jgi:Zn-dependent protease with chaperone function
MKVARRFLIAGCAAVFLAAVSPRSLTAQSPAAPTAPAQAAAPANSQQAYTLPPDKLAKAIAHTRIVEIVAIIDAIWSVVFIWILLSTRAWSGIEGWALRMAKRRWLQGVLFFFAFFLLTTFASLPLSAYLHEVSLAYGISVQGWGSWFGDQAKTLGLTLVAGVPVLLLFHWIVRRWPRRYWLGVWIATVPVLVLFMFVEPLVEPLFYKFEPLTKNYSQLVQELEKVAARTGTNIPPDRMFLMKASMKTNGLNAYVTGLEATKRIVVWDTTAGRIPDDEVLFIFGHESGHYVLHHIPKTIAGYAMALFFAYWACAAIAAWLARRFGPRWGVLSSEDSAQSESWQSSRTGFVVLLFVVYLANFILQPAQSAFSRYLEHQADVYGQEAIHGIVADPQATAVAAFNTLGAAWLEDPNPNRFIEFWFYDHPSTQRRATFALHYDPWANGGRGEFFAK